MNDNSILLNPYFHPSQDISDIVSIRLEYSNCYEIGDEIQQYIDQMKHMSLHYKTEFNDKTLIVKHLVINFSYIGRTLQTVQNYLHSSNIQVKQELKETFMKLINDKVESYLADQKELLLIDKLREVSCSVTRLPPTLRCLLWKTRENIPFCNSLPNEANNNQQPPDESEEKLKSIFSFMNQFRKKIKAIKQRIEFVNEVIIWLFDTSRDYMSTLVKIERELSKVEDCNEATLIVRDDILSVFNIEEKIDFFSNLENSYELTTGYEKLRLQLK